METVYDLFMQYGGLTVWLFIVALPPQIIKNWWNGKYASGPRITWVLFIVAYFSFGFYLLCKTEYIANIGQFTGGMFSVVVFAQSFMYKWA